MEEQSNQKFEELSKLRKAIKTEKNKNLELSKTKTSYVVLKSYYDNLKSKSNDYLSILFWWESVLKDTNCNKKTNISRTDFGLSRSNLGVREGASGTKWNILWDLS